MTTLRDAVLLDIKVLELKHNQLLSHKMREALADYVVTLMKTTLMKTTVAGGKDELPTKDEAVVPPG